MRGRVERGRLERTRKSGTCFLRARVILPCLFFSSLHARTRREGRPRRRRGSFFARQGRDCAGEVVVHAPVDRRWRRQKPARRPGPPPHSGLRFFRCVAQRAKRARRPPRPHAQLPWTGPGRVTPHLPGRRALCQGPAVAPLARARDEEKVRAFRLRARGRRRALPPHFSPRLPSAGHLPALG